MSACGGGKRAGSGRAGGGGGGSSNKCARRAQRQYAGALAARTGASASLQARQQRTFRAGWRSKVRASRCNVLYSTLSTLLSAGAGMAPGERLCALGSGGPARLGLVQRLALDDELQSGQIVRLWTWQAGRARSRQHGESRAQRSLVCLAELLYASTQPG